MGSWKNAWVEGAVAGGIASVLSTAYLAWAGRRRGTAAAPVNAVSHWFFGDRALRRDGASLRYTLTGYLIHHVASVFWGTLHARYWAQQPGHRAPVPAAAGALGASAVACLVDYRLTPKRLTPGFEHRLDRKEMAAVYGVFAAGLLLGTLLMKRR